MVAFLSSNIMFSGYVSRMHFVLHGSIGKSDGKKQHIPYLIGLLTKNLEKGSCHGPTRGSFLIQLPLGRYQGRSQDVTYKMIFSRAFATF